MQISNLKRVVITGLGVISPIGNTVEDFWKNLCNGVSGIDFVSYFDTSDFSTKIGGQLKDFDPCKIFDRKAVHRMAKFCQLAMCASNEAVLNSKLDISENPERVAVIIGSGIGGFDVIEAQHSALIKDGPSRVSPLTIPMLIPNMASSQVSIYFGAKGANTCPSTACASGSNAVGDAFRLIQLGLADAAITGGTEAGITPLSFAGFCSAKTMSRKIDNPSKSCRPFDIDRDGFVMGEGSGILILEELEHAKKRNAKIYAEIVGYAMTGDAHHITLPELDGKGIELCMKQALVDANIKASDMDYINAHGTSTKMNDKIESNSIKRVFAERDDIMVSSTKSMTGHLLGAAGGIEAIACILALQDGIIPPTINYETPDPECALLDYVPNIARKKNINFAMSNSMGFGGHNVSLVFKKYI